MNTLQRIHQLVLDRRVIFTAKAQEELLRDGILRREVYEAILSARAIAKTVASRNPSTGKRETLYVIKGVTYAGLPLYTKGTIRKDRGEEVFYLLISSKRSTDA